MDVKITKKKKNQLESLRIGFLPERGTEASRIISFLVHSHLSAPNTKSNAGDSAEFWAAEELFPVQSGLSVPMPTWLEES